MYPPSFRYYRASSLAEAISLLQREPEARLLAGGHSLIPAMKLRLAAPPALIDIGRVPELKGIRRQDGGWAVGAMTTHREIEFSDLPLLADIDTGFGASAFNVARTVRSLEKAGAAACHIEDQVGAKRCGHRPGKEIVGKDEMVDRVKAAADARSDENFVIMARTDALAVEGLDAAIERAVACVEAGADMIFPEAMTSLEMYKQFADAVKVPVLANITEFGSTPLFTLDELRSANVSIALYPLSAFRAMNQAAENVYQAIRRDGTQKNVLDTMQTRAELYDRIDYHSYEQKLDALFAQKKTK